MSEEAAVALVLLRRPLFMTNLDVLAFVVWDGGLFNVGFLAGWFACRRALRQSIEAKGLAQDDGEPRSALLSKLSVSEGEAPQTDRQEPPAFAQLSTEKRAVREGAERRAS
jgi:hypothetical protein